jgi:hypothetical protein
MHGAHTHHACSINPHTHQPPLRAPRPPGHAHTGIAVRDLSDEIDMEVDVRWVGDANITLGIDLPIGGCVCVCVCVCVCAGVWEGV